MQGRQGLGEPQPRILQGHPGQALLLGQLLQLRVERQQQGRGAAAGQGGAELVAGFQKRELAGDGLIHGSRPAQHGVICEMPRCCVSEHALLGELEQQGAEAHAAGAAN
jgi:hypothetical protein